VAKREAPEFALLKPSSKALVRKLGCTEDHTISSEEGLIGKGWRDVEDMGWVTIRNHDRYGMSGGYTILFNLTGWERWCRQVDVEEGADPATLPLCEYE
jgi:hypothetical protein